MTKKLLLGSTALVGAFAIAAPAFADIEVTLSGQVEFGSKIGDKETQNDGDVDNRGYFFFMDSETKIQAEGAADNGINYSGKVELETDADIQNVNADEAVVSFWGGFGRVEFGREDGAEDSMYVGGEDFQAGTGGIDGDATNLSGFANINDSNDSAKITYYTPRVAGFQLGASFAPDEDDEETGADVGGGAEEKSIGVGANFQTSAAGADITLSGVAIFADDEGGVATRTDDKKDYAVGVGVEFAGLGIGAGYIKRDDDDSADGFNVGIKYGFGPANVSLGYSYEDEDDINNDNSDGNQSRDGSLFVASADYGVFPGVTLKGDISHNTDDRDDPSATSANSFDSTTAGVVTIQLDY